MTKIFVFGLDCAPPSIIFDPTLPLPNIRRLMNSGDYGELSSIVPCITVPAWASMMSGKDPGELGIYGFRNRADHSYDKLTLATANSIDAEMFWDSIAKQGKRSILVGVPPSYPAKPVNGSRVGCFLTPDGDSNFTYPASLKEELRARFGSYKMDVVGFRTDDKPALLKQIYEMTAQHTDIVKHLITTQNWDFGMWVEIGTDRIHHGFWRWHDTEHRKFKVNASLNGAIRAYYIWLDSKIGEVIALLPSDCRIILVSDHGAKKMDGGICLNEWLIEQGYLVLDQTHPSTPTPFGKLKVDWSRTTAWGDGGYYGRLFINVQNREPNGIVLPERINSLLDQITDGLKDISDDRGEKIATKVFRPRDIYREVRGIPPDLMIYFGDLLWRSIGSVGHAGIHTLENDSGPDDCNHAEAGIFIRSFHDELAIPKTLLGVFDYLMTL